MQIPLFEIYGTIVQSHFASLAITLPAITISATSGGELNFNLPGVTFLIEGRLEPNGNMIISLPAFLFSASVDGVSEGRLAMAIPAIAINIKGLTSEVASLNIMLPSLSIDISTLSDISASLDIVLPLPGIVSSGYWSSPGILSITLPSLKFLAIKSTILSGLSFNTKNFALTSYPTYDYNGFVNFNGKSLGFSKTGVYELTGNGDGVKGIPWKLRSGKLDMKHDHLRQLWLSGKFGDNVTMIVEDAEGNQYEYAGISSYENENEIRIKPGKGIKSRYIIFELSGTDTVNIALDRMRVFGMKSVRKR